MTSEDTTVNISTRLMFGLGQAGADWKWTSDTTTTDHVIEADEQVTEPKSDLSDLDDLYEYYSMAYASDSQVLR